MYALLFTLLSVVFRMIPHLPNFSPAGAAAVIAGRTLSFPKTFVLILGQVLLVNALLTYAHGYPLWMPSYAYVVLGFLMQAGLARMTKKLPGGIFLAAIVGSFLFFMTSNLGVWMEGVLYSKTLQGLVECYQNALPFYRNSLVGDLVWTTVFATVIQLLELSKALRYKTQSLHESHSKELRVSNSLIELAKTYISDEFVSKVSSLIGESPDKTKSAVTSAIPTLLAGLIQKVANPQGASAIFDLIKHGGHDGSILNNLGAVLTGNTSNLLSSGTGIIESIFGAKSSGVGSLIASVSGISQASSGKLLGILGPVVMGLIGKQIKTTGVAHSSGLASMLLSQKDSILSSLPAGLGPVLGFASASDLGASSLAAGSAGAKKLIPLLAAALAAVALLWVLKNKSAQKMTDAAQSAGTQVQTAMENSAEVAAKAAQNVQDSAAQAVSSLGNFFKKTLSTGVELSVPENGIENKLISFIEDTSKPVDKTTWFTLDRITFETGSAKLSVKSEEQLKNLGEILKAFPGVELKVGGYTDNSGDVQANIKLSGERANAVVEELTKLGVPANRLKAEGYGPEHPVADNATEEGKSQNRRIDVRVMKK